MASDEAMRELQDKITRFQKVIDGFGGLSFTTTYVSSGYDERTGEINISMPLELQKTFSTCKEGLEAFWKTVEKICTTPGYWENLAMQKRKIDTGIAVGIEYPEESAYIAYNDAMTGKTSVIANYKARFLDGPIRSETVLTVCSSTAISIPPEGIDDSMLN